MFKRKISLKLKIPLFLFFLISIYFFAEYRTGGFRTYKIVFDPERGDGREGDEENILEIFSQKFIYFDKGRQSFVFKSSDEKYVIKFLNIRNLYYPEFLKHVPISIIKSSIKRKRRRTPQTFDSLRLAYFLKDETAILYTNIDVKKRLNKKITLVNRYGAEVLFDLDRSFFVVQRVAKPIFEHLDSGLDDRCFKSSLDAFLVCVRSRLKKGIADDDISVGRNYGFIGDRVIIMDIGKLYREDRLKDPRFYKEELVRSTKDLKRWLIKKYPKMVSYLENRVNSPLICQ